MQRFDQNEKYIKGYISNSQSLTQEQVHLSVDSPFKSCQQDQNQDLLHLGIKNETQNETESKTVSNLRLRQDRDSHQSVFPFPYSFCLFPNSLSLIRVVVVCLLFHIDFRFHLQHLVQSLSFCSDKVNNICGLQFSEQINQ